MPERDRRTPSAPIEIIERDVLHLTGSSDSHRDELAERRTIFLQPLDHQSLVSRLLDGPLTQLQ